MSGKVLGRHAVFAALALAAALLFAGGPRVLVALAYERAAVARGQVWRLATGHLVHASLAHLVWNLAGLALVWAAVGRALSARAWTATAAIAALGSSAALFLFHPQVRALTGLSGLLHGLLAAGAVAEIRRGNRAAWGLLGVVAVKVAWEQAMGAPTAAGLGGPIAADAHLYGVVAGALCAAITPRKPSP